MYELIELDTENSEEYPVNKSCNIEDLYKDFLEIILSNCNVFNEEKGFFVDGKWEFPPIDDDLWDEDCTTVHVPNLQEIIKEIDNKNYYQINYDNNQICCGCIFRKL